ncbi:SA1362 family protein [Alkalihalobacillus deserti]|uniref:SA1362 family protein n=1 Tax=Alkalihalobacillus deserti TaxID=2879466 RepID=UPI001D15982D|nr:SA1362 family protein [Alkalihalobacillus deserti]
MRSIMKYIIPAVLIFAIIGLGYELLFNPLGFLTRILMMIGFIAVIFIIYRWFMARRYGTPLFPSQTGPSGAQLKKAKRTSTQRQASSPSGAVFKSKRVTAPQTKKKPIRSSTKQRREGHNLKVIEGKKQKKKSRAFF